MKKILMLLTSLLLVSSLQATEYGKKDRLKDMRAMTKALNHIQKGLVGTCVTCVKSGVMDLKTALRALDSIDAKDYLPKEQARAHKFARKMAKNVKIYADATLEAYNDKEYFEAMDMFSLTMNQCVSCHMRVRDWDKRGRK